MKIIVFGSINIDFIARTSRLPVPGETIIGYDFQNLPGGKGANQAVACARLGAETMMIGCVGSDIFGDNIITELKNSGIDVSLISRNNRVSTGVALITVNKTGENNIIIIPGANGEVGKNELMILESTLEKVDILLLQLEIPIDIVLQAAILGKEKKVTVILDPAPAQKFPEELFRLVDVFTPNEIETASLVGFNIDSWDKASKAAHIFLQKGVRQSVIKMGNKGTLLTNQKFEQIYPSVPVEAIDTVGAGDAFNGALAVALNEGKTINEAVQWGNAAGAFAVTRKGAQTAMPSRSELTVMLGKLER
ncbi:Ribokinase [subsurface metagenome]